MGSLCQYLHYIEHLYQTSQGQVLARQLSLNGEHVNDKNLWLYDTAGQVARRRTTLLDDLIVHHLLCVKALNMQYYVEAFNHQIICMNEIIRILRNYRGSCWMLPVMFTVCVDLRMVAQKADTVSNAKGEILQKAADTLMYCFRICAEDTTNPEEYSKKAGVLGPVNNLLHIYFRAQHYNMCSSIIRAVESTVHEGSFSMSQLVTFRFFVGRMAICDGKFKTAEQHLLFAFNKCHPQSYKNKRTILTYLLPVKMLLGYMPVRRLVEKYDLPLFWHLLLAIKNGKIRVMEEIINRNARYFDNAGLMNAINHLKVVTYRNVLKKVFLSLKCSRVPISCFRAGLEIMAKRPVEDTATQSLIAAMIFHHKINAYMSYSHETIIFSPSNPFPRLSTLKCEK